MPEAPVDKDHRAWTGEHQVRRAGQGATMQAVQNEMQTAEGHMVTCVPGPMAAVEQATGNFPEPAQR